MSWTPEEDATFLQMIQDRVPNPKIARALGKTRGMIAGKRHRLNDDLKAGRVDRSRLPRGDLYQATPSLRLLAQFDPIIFDALNRTVHA